MSNHPNRSRARSPASNPTPEEIKTLRCALGLTQTEAAAVIYCTLTGWQKWEGGNRRMHPAFWELFRNKTFSQTPS